jgi:flagellar assembly factor FliW
MNALQQDAARPESEKIMVRTSRFGEIAVDPARVISMISPFLGFPESIRFMLKSHGPNSPFMWLQSLDNPQLAFVVIRAALLDLHTKLEIPRPILRNLQITSEHDKDILLILTIPKDNPREMTANLLGPIVLNSRMRLAAQVVLDPQKYDPCWRVFGGKAA